MSYTSYNFEGHYIPVVVCGHKISFQPMIAKYASLLVPCDIPRGAGREPKHNVHSASAQRPSK